MYCRFHIFLWTFSSDCEFRQIITLRKFAIREQILKTEVENSRGTFKTRKSKRNWHCHGKNEKRAKDWATQTPKNRHQQSKYIFYSKSSISGVLQNNTYLFILLLFELRFDGMLIKKDWTFTFMLIISRLVYYFCQFVHYSKCWVTFIDEAWKYECITHVTVHL